MTRERMIGGSLCGGSTRAATVNPLSTLAPRERYLNDKRDRADFHKSPKIPLEIRMSQSRDKPAEDCRCLIYDGSVKKWRRDEDS